MFVMLSASVIASSESGIKFLTLEYIPVIFTTENAVLLVAAFLLSLSLSLSFSLSKGL